MAGPIFTKLIILSIFITVLPAHCAGEQMLLPRSAGVALDSSLFAADTYRWYRLTSPPPSPPVNSQFHVEDEEGM